MLNRHMKEFLIALALKFGAMVSPDTWELVLPTWGRGMVDKYTITETRDQETGKIVYRVTQKGSDGP